MSACSNTTALRLTAQTTTVVGGDMDRVSGQSGIFVVDITAITGTAPSATILIEGRDAASGKYYPILTSAAITAVSTTILRVFPGATPAANLAANDIIPKTYRVTCTIAGTTPAVTATIGVLLSD